MRLALPANGLILVCGPLPVHLYGVPGAAASTVLCRAAALALGLRALHRTALPRTAARTRPRRAPPGRPAYSIAYKVMYLATMAFYSVRQAASLHTAHTRGSGGDARRDVGRQAVLVAADRGPHGRRAVRRHRALAHDRLPGR